MKFSIIIITYNRKKKLSDCLSSLAIQLNNPFEVIVIFNGDLTYISKMKQLYSSVQFHYIPKTSPAHARNFAIPKATGEFLFFLDDDCVLPADYFNNIDFNDGWDVLGGPDKTPPQSKPLQVNIGKALASPLCMGFTAKRHNSYSEKRLSMATERELILCNLWVRKNIFDDKTNFFPGELFRNEENYLLKKLHIENKNIFYDPNLFVYHSRKENLEDFSNSIIKSGECRIINFTKLKTHKELVYFLPLIFSILFLILVFSLSFPMIILFSGYIFSVFIHGIIKEKTYSPVYTCLHFLILFSYSIGLIKGISNFSIYKLKSIVH